MTNSVEKISAVLFDMDGVLIDSNSVIERAWIEAGALFDIQITAENIVKHIHGQPGPHTIKTLFGHLSIDDQKKVQAYIVHAENTADYDPIAGVAQLILSLSSAKIKVGIVTSGWREKIDRVMNMLQIQHCISVIVDRDDVSRGKPFPDPYILGAKRLALPPNQILVFEDSISGVTSAVNAGAYCVGIGDGTLIKYGAKTAISDFSKVRVIKQANGNYCVSLDRNHELIIENR
ncbi:HAD family phosphatase [Orbaceae bacterium ac157xtp]